MSDLPDETVVPDSTAQRGSVYADDLFCPECGYSLRGLTSARCPECGLGLERIRALGTTIPWAHRGAIGAWRAYWRTARWATFRGRRFFGGVPPLVDYVEAQRFRWITVAIFAATALLVYVAYCVTNSDLVDDLLVNGWYRGVQFVAGVLAMAALTGLPSYLFHPRHLSVEDQNRAVAMSYYACAPLAFVSWALPLYAIATLLSLARRFEFDSAPWLALMLTVLAFVYWWLQLVRLGRTVFRRGWAKVRVAVLVPVLWLVVWVLVFDGITWLTLYAVSLVYALF